MIRTWGELCKMGEDDGACCPECWAAGYTFAKAHELVVLGKGILFGAAAVAIVVWS